MNEESNIIAHLHLREVIMEQGDDGFVVLLLQCCDIAMDRDE